MNAERFKTNVNIWIGWVYNMHILSCFYKMRTLAFPQFINTESTPNLLKYCGVGFTIQWHFWFIKTIIIHHLKTMNPLSAKPTKCSNTLKHLVGKLPTNCLSLFDHLLGLALKGLKLSSIKNSPESTRKILLWNTQWWMGNLNNAGG